MDIFKKNSLELILRFGDSDTNITYPDINPYPCNIVHFYRWQLYFWSIVIACQFLPRILIFAKLIFVYFCFLADSVPKWFFLEITTFDPKNHENHEQENTSKITKITSKRPQNRGKITEKVLVWIYFWFFVTEMITFWAKLEDFPNFLGNFPKSRTFRGSWLVTEQKFLSRGSSSKSRISW